MGTVIIKVKKICQPKKTVNNPRGMEVFFKHEEDAKAPYQEKLIVQFKNSAYSLICMNDEELVLLRDSLNNYLNSKGYE